AVAAITGAMCRNLPRGGRVVVASTRDANLVRLSFQPVPGQAGVMPGVEAEAARAAVVEAQGRLLVLADTVILELPAFEGSRPQAEGARGTVLVADDDPSMLSLMAAVLRRKGFTVIEAENGVAASSFLRTHGAEIVAVVTDAVLPGRSGVELAGEAATSFPGLPVLVVTSHDAKLVGVKDLPLLRKPFGAKLFADRVEQLLRRES
ncbi:MAG: response regulator, partial [Deltaproteobacteria bacterium]|nr:response regulator [Deltaproteobacteria bacterium]